LSLQEIKPGISIGNTTVDMTKKSTQPTLIVVESAERRVIATEGKPE
jgi:hypothetical protein